MERIYKEFGRRLREAREAAELSQEVVAKRVGLSRTSITNIELGKQNVSLHMLYLLASAVGAKPISLLPDRVSETSSDVVTELLRKAGIPEGAQEQEWVKRIVTATNQKAEKHK